MHKPKSVSFLCFVRNVNDINNNVLRLSPFTRYVNRCSLLISNGEEKGESKDLLM